MKIKLLALALTFSTIGLNGQVSNNVQHIGLITRGEKYVPFQELRMLFQDFIGRNLPAGAKVTCLEDKASEMASIISCDITK